MITSNIIWTTKSQVLHINEMYHFIQESQNFFIEKPQPCLNTPGTNDTYSYSSSQCFGIFNFSHNQTLLDELKYFIDLTSMMTQVRLMINRTQSIYFSHKNNLQFFSITTGVWFINYYPHQRPWYSQHLQLQKQQNSEFVFGNAFQTYAGDIQLPFSKNFTNIKGQYQGVIVQDINFQFYTALNNQDNVVLITDQNGLLLFCIQYSIKQSQNKIYFVYNQQITGFNYDDWIQIKNYGDNITYENNCSLKIQKGILCRYNKLLNQDTIVLIQNLNNTPYFIIIFQNIHELQNEETQIIKLINEKLKDTMKYLFIIFLLVTIILLIIQQFLMALIISPLFTIMVYMNKKINNNLKNVNETQLSINYNFLNSQITILIDHCLRKRYNNLQYPNSGIRKIRQKVQASLGKLKDRWIFHKR
ncbi:hypothetical protein pb186bvf_007671 [Paramecium bursaria]